jgi:hypothetical protein
MSLQSRLLGLGQRFDTLALRPPDVAPASQAGGRLAVDPGSLPWAALWSWCHKGAGPGGLPRVDQRLAIGALQGTDGATAVAFAEALARQIDGSTRLAALPGRAAGLAFRLGVKLHDAMWWRPRQPDDPWDAGWVIDTPLALDRLANGFLPRRATLVLADGQAPERLRPALAAMAQRQADFRHPVRWLWVGGAPDLSAPDLMSMARFDLV